GVYCPCRHQQSGCVALLSLPTPNKISYTGPRAAVSHRQIIPRKDGSDRRAMASALSRTHTIFSDRTLIHAPDCVSQLGCDSYAGCEHTPKRRPGRGGATTVTPEALGGRRAAISLAHR